MVDCTCTNFPASLGNVTFGANVGIGTSAPTTPLHVVAPANTAARFDFYNDPALSLRLTESYGPQIDFSRQGSANLRFRSSTDGATFTERLRLQHDGKIFMAPNGGDVGIGDLLDTGSKLQVNGNVAIGFGNGATGVPTNGLGVQGAVGIGVALPATGAKLEVSGGSVRVGGREAINASGQALYA